MSGTSDSRPAGSDSVSGLGGIADFRYDRPIDTESCTGRLLAVRVRDARMASTVRCLRKGSSVWTLHSGSWPSPGPRAARRRTSPRLPRAAPGDLGSAIVRDHGVAANHAEVVGHRVPAAAPDRVSLRGRHREVDAVVAHVAAIAVPDIA